MISYNNIGHGTYLRAFELARGLVKLGESVTLLASTRDEQSTQIEETSQAGVHIAGIPNRILRAGWDPLNIIGRLKWIRNHHDFDVVHGFESRPAVIFPALRLMKAGVPLVLDWCDWFGKGGSVEERPNFLIRSILRPLETYFENHFRKVPRATTVICSTLRERTINFGVTPETIKIIYNGFNIPNFQPTEKTQARTFFDLNSEDFVIGYIGALFPKDAKLMEDSFSLTLDNLPNARLLHLGNSNYRLNINESYKQAIITTGPISEQTLMRGLSACDVFWLPLSDIPANWGRFPLKFSNYLAAGKPIIATAIGDSAKIIQFNKVGQTCEATPEAIACATNELAKNTSKRKSMAKAAINLSQKSNHSWEARANALLELYYQVLSNYEK